MLGRVVKSTLLSIVVFILVYVGVFALQGYMSFRLIQSNSVDLILEKKHRFLDLVKALGVLAQASSSEGKYVALSETMYQMAVSSKGKEDDFIIEKILLVDPDGNALAHSDFTKLAANNKEKLDQSLLASPFVRVPQDPLGIRTTAKHEKPKDELQKALYQLAEFIDPQLIAKQYEVTAAVFPVDTVTPGGAVFCFVNVNFLKGFYRTVPIQLKQIALSTLAWSAGLTTLIWFIFLMVLGRSSRMNGQSNDLQQSPVNSKDKRKPTYHSKQEEFPSAQAIPEIMNESDTSEGQGSRILDAIPLRRP